MATEICMPKNGMDMTEGTIVRWLKNEGDKVEKDEPIRECLNCNKGCVDAIQNRRYISCVLNAENVNMNVPRILKSESYLRKLKMFSKNN